VSEPVPVSELATVLLALPVPVPEPVSVSEPVAVLLPVPVLEAALVELGPSSPPSVPVTALEPPQPEITTPSDKRSIPPIFFTFSPSFKGDTRRNRKRALERLCVFTLEKTITSAEQIFKNRTSDRRASTFRYIPAGGETGGNRGTFHAILNDPRFDPYAAPGVLGSAAARSTDVSPVRTGAWMVLVGDAGRAILWRLNAAIAILYPSWPHPTILNYVIKLLGAVVVLSGAWSLTQGQVPALARAATRSLASIALGGHVARLAFALLSAAAFAWEPATTLLDAVAVSACILCVAPRVHADPTRRWVGSATLLAAAYLMVSATSALLLLATGPGTHIRLDGSAIPRAALSVIMIGLAAWGVTILVQVPRRDARRRRRRPRSQTSSLRRQDNQGP
jgi:hypothetical protein